MVNVDSYIFMPWLKYGNPGPGHFNKQTRIQAELITMNVGLGNSAPVLGHNQHRNCQLYKDKLID